MTDADRSAAVVHAALVEAARSLVEGFATEGSTIEDDGPRVLAALVRANLATHARVRVDTRYAAPQAFGSAPGDRDAAAAVASWSAEIAEGGARVVQRFDASAAMPFQAKDHAALLVAATPPGGLPTVLVLEMPESADPWTDDEVDQIAMLVDTLSFVGAAHDAARAARGLRDVLDARRTPVGQAANGPTQPGLTAIEEDEPTKPLPLPREGTTRQVEVPEVIRSGRVPATRNREEPATRVDNWMDEMKLKAAIEAKAIELKAQEQATRLAVPNVGARAPVPEPAKARNALVIAVVLTVVTAVAWLAGARMAP